MENFKKFLNEAKKETASVEEIEKVILAVLKKEGGAAGLKPIEDALSELDKEMPEGFDLMDHLKKMKDSMVKIHDDGDVIEMGGLTEQDQDGDGDKDFADVIEMGGLEEGELEEGAKPDFLDLDGDGDKEESMKKAAADKKKAKAQKKK